MPKKQTILQVFLGSPSDVSSECEIVDTVVRELNLMWSEIHAIQLEILRWETHVHSGIDDDAQAVVNRQIPEDYDIFLGIMWARYGSPTKRSESGTVEEYEKALLRQQRNAQAMEIMWYFKDAPLAPSQVNPEQLGKVYSFKQRLQTDGVLFHQFLSSEEFAGSLRLHLTSYINKYVKRAGHEILPSSTQVVVDVEHDTSMPNALLPPDDEMGFLDLIEIATEHMHLVNSTAGRISAATEMLGNQVSERANVLLAVGAEFGQTSPAKLKQLINFAAGDMELYVTQMRVEVPQLVEHSQIAISSYANAISMIPMEEAGMTTALSDASAVMYSLRQTLDGSRESIFGLRTSVASLPPFTSKLNRAKRATVDILDELVAKMSSLASLTVQAENSFRQLLD